jgi:orotidine-5'-phosphate decarboxylase
MPESRFKNPVFVALDTPDLAEALKLAAHVRPHVGGFKVGLEFMTANGPEGVRRIVGLGLPVFADTKFHDIPNTVAGASRAIASLGVAIFNVHASGGSAMMQAAADAARQVDPAIKTIAVTVLTSLDDNVLSEVGQHQPAREQVARLAALTKSAGLNGVVCAAHEIAIARQTGGREFLVVVPGIRPAGSALGDQRRVMSPGEAQQAGADILVIGRPISAAADPARAAAEIASSLALSAA